MEVRSRDRFVNRREQVINLDSFPHGDNFVEGVTEPPIEGDCLGIFIQNLKIDLRTTSG